MAIGADDQPVTVSLTGDTRRNVIVWMDHRAVREADRINGCDSPVLQFVGGKMSPEMQPPKVKLQILNPEPSTLNPQNSTLNPKLRPEILHPKCCTPDLKP